MKFKTAFCMALLTTVGSAPFAAEADLAVAPVASAVASTDAPVTQSWQTLVESLAAHPDVLTKDWSSVRRVLPVGCFKNPGHRDLTCPPMEGIVSVSVDPGPLGIVDVVLTGPASCDQIYALMSHHFGKGTLEGGDKCNAEWKLNRWVKRASANLSRGRKDKSLLYLQFAIEQGP
jgi:hypothetical protein